MATALPIDSILPDIVASLKESPSLVLEAPPGAGKTTRVPPALLDTVEGQILVLEPRRLAARLAARRVAEELGEKVGGRVGYRVRFEDVTGRDTRIVFVTEGVLLRRLAEDPLLRGVGAVLLDEFHERHLHGDLGLALTRRLQRTSRPELRIAAMSATLEADPVAGFLGGCPILRAEGRRFEVAIEHAARPAAPDRPLELDVAQAVKQALSAEPDGDVLVFLPGAYEIRRAQAALQLKDVDVVMLHGDLAPEEQDRAISRGRRRKVILSTNVAETSVTIEGVVAVVDSGLHRLASHSPWSGLPTLKVAKISRASAIQRAGRAGRVRPGRCLRLYTKQELELRPAHDAPEVARVDLTETVLLLSALGIRDLEWFETPPPAGLEAARELLTRLGALDGEITPLGKRMLELPVHPRQARLLVEAEVRGVADDGAVVAALAGERELTRKKEKVAGPSDLLADLDRFREAERMHPDRMRSLGLDVGAVMAVSRLKKQLRAGLRPKRRMPDGPEVDAALGLCVLAGYPDRVARRRKPNGRDLILSGGGTATLSPDSVVQSEWMVAVDAEERNGVMVRSASSIEPDWLIELYADRIAQTRSYQLGNERVELVEKLSYDQLTLDEKRAPAPPDEEAARVLYEEARGRNLVGGGELFERIAFVRAHFPELNLPEIDPDVALKMLCRGRTSFDQLREASPDEILDSLDGKLRRDLGELAPARITLGHRTVQVSYPAGQPPFIESRLQDFFGLAKGPTVGRGRVPLTLHLLAPNQRAVQVTSDLAGFWERHYPSIRRELSRKYPRHSWPDDPLTARPPEPRRK